MANLNSTISKYLREEIGPGIRDSLPALDGLWSKMHTTYMGVTSDGIGRDYKVIHPFYEGLSGAVQWVAAGGEDVYATQMTHGVIPGTPRVFPGLDQSVMPGAFNKTITLTELLANVFIPDEYLRGDKLSASIASSVETIFKGHYKLAALAEIIPFFSNDGTKQYLCAVANSPTLTAATTSIVVRKGSVQTAYTGTHVDVYDSTMATKRNSVDLVIDGVRYIPLSGDTAGYGALTLRTVDGSLFSTSAAGIVAGDLIVLRSNVSSAAGLGPKSPKSWLLSAPDSDATGLAANTTFGIDVRAYQQMQSVVATSLNQALDGVLVTKLCSRFMRAYGMENMPDTFITSQGVKNAIVEVTPSLGSLMVFRNQNERYVPKEGYRMDSSPFEFNGMPINLMVSGYFPSDTDFTAQATSYGGSAWGLKLRDKNLMRYVPPPISGSGTDPKLGREAEFKFGNGYGPNGLFWPVTSADRPTFWSQAPWTKRVAICPKVLQGIRAEGLAESL